MQEAVGEDQVIFFSLTLRLAGWLQPKKDLVWWWLLASPACPWVREAPLQALFSVFLVGGSLETVAGRGGADAVFSVRPVSKQPVSLVSVACR